MASGAAAGAHQAGEAVVGVDGAAGSVAGSVAYLNVLASWAVAMRAENKSAKTIRTRHYGITALANRADPLTATADQVREWLADQGSAWTRATYYATARAWFAFLVAERLRVDDPTAGIRRPREPRRVPRPVPARDLAWCLADTASMPRGDGDAGPCHLHAYLVLSAYAGLRVHEIAKIRGEDVTSSGLRVLGKGNREDVIPTHPLVWALAQSMPRRGWWFPSPRAHRGHVLANTVSQQMSRYFREVGVEATAHMVRHSFGTRVIEASGRDLVTTQQLMRHESPRTTVGYLLVSDERRRAVILGLDGPDGASLGGVA